MERVCTLIIIIIIVIIIINSLYRTYPNPFVLIVLTF